ncbi:hypothetical protein GCM10028809_53150 [Spirosoma gilvum]
MSDLGIKKSCPTAIAVGQSCKLDNIGIRINPYLIRVYPEIFSIIPNLDSNATQLGVNTIIVMIAVVAVIGF